MSGPACETGRRPWWAVAGMVGAVALLSAAATAGEYLSPPGPSPLRVGVDVAVGLFGCVAVVLLRRRPVPIVVGLVLLAGLSPAGTAAAGAGMLELARRRRLSTVVTVAVIGVLAQLVRWQWQPIPGLSPGWWLVLVVAVYAALVGCGSLVQARCALIANVAAHARRAERTRIAREMHDVLAHRLSLLATYAGAVEFRPDAGPEQVSRAAAVIRSSAHEALDELREVIGVLRESDVAPEDRPQPTIADIGRLVAQSRQAGVAVRLDDRVVDAAAVPDRTGRTVYRIVQEGLTNARKHAAGQPVSVALHGEAGRRLTVEVSNPLPALARSVAPGSGTGLIGLAERVQLADGELDHGATAAGEFRLSARLPWPAR